MYIPKQFEETDVAKMHELIRSHPLATLVTLTPSGLNANHIPLILTESENEAGVLQGHVARSNPMWRDAEREREVLAVFQSGEAYISPNWYATKEQTGKVVPTWNYSVVHAHGFMTVHEDAEWLRIQITKMTDLREARFPVPWKVSDAPADYIEKLIGSIVGIEIVVNRLEGKWKVSQNQPLENRSGVIEGLTRRGDVGDIEMAKKISNEREPG